MDTSADTFENHVLEFINFGHRHLNFLICWLLEIMELNFSGPVTRLLSKISDPWVVLHFNHRYSLFRVFLEHRLNQSQNSVFVFNVSFNVYLVIFWLVIQDLSVQLLNIVLL